MKIKQRCIQIIRNRISALIYLAIFIALSLFVPSFFTLRNMLSLGRQISVVGIAAVGLTFVMLSGNSVDLSVGSIISLSGVVCCWIITHVSGTAGGIAVGIAAAVSIGLVIGLINGLMVSVVGVNPFIMTVITQMFFEGIALSITKGNSIGMLPKPFLQIAKAELYKIPVLIFALLFFLLLCQYVVKRHYIGRIIYAVGSNKTGSELVGISAHKTQILCYMFSGFCGSISGITLSSRLSSASSSMGGNILLDIISAVIIGGASIFGGKGSIMGTAIGILCIGLIGNAINLLGISHNLSMVLKGAIVLLAVVIDVLRENTSRKKLLER